MQVSEFFEKNPIRSGKKQSCTRKAKKGNSIMRNENGEIKNPLTAEQAIGRLALNERKWYVHIGSGSTGTGAEWNQIIRDIEKRGDARRDAVFDPDGDSDVFCEMPPNIKDYRACLKSFAELAQELVSSDRGLSFPTADAGSGSAGPQYITADDLQEIVDSGEIDEYDELCPDDAQDILLGIIDVLDPNGDTIVVNPSTHYRVAERIVHDGEFIDPSDYRHYIVLWEIED